MSITPLAEVGSSRLQSFGDIGEEAESSVASVAQQSTDGARDVVVVYAQVTITASANSTGTVLDDDHGLVFDLSDPVTELPTVVR